MTTYQDPIARKDRTDLEGGGVAVMVQFPTPYTILALQTTLEATAVQVYLPTTTISVCSLYLPPDNALNPTLADDLSNLITQLPRPFVICTDANAHNITWGSENTNPRGQIIEDWLLEEELEILNTKEPTYLCSSGKFSHIDITIVSEGIADLLTWNPHHDTMDSDHFPLLIKSALDLEPGCGLKCWKTDKANWKEFCKNLELPTRFYSQ